MPGSIDKRMRHRACKLPLLGLLTSLVAIGGCDDFPRDIAGTMNEIQATHVVRTGIVADGAAQAGERSLAEKIAIAAGAKAVMEPGSAEILMHRLEDGDLDLVVGMFAKSSPWHERVALTKDPGRETQPGEKEPVLRAAVRHGENRWFIFVSKTIDDEV